MFYKTLNRNRPLLQNTYVTLAKKKYVCYFAMYTNTISGGHISNIRDIKNIRDPIRFVKVINYAIRLYP